MSVIVNGDVAGNVIIPTSNPEYGYIRVSQTRQTFDENGFLKPQRLSALVLGLVSDLKELGWKAGQEIPGKIVVKESLIPFNKKNPEIDMKKAGDTGIVCCVDDQPIYRKCFYVSDESIQDSPHIAHTNKDQIVEAYQELIEINAAKTAVTPSGDDNDDFQPN